MLKWDSVFLHTDQGDLVLGYLTLLCFTVPMSTVAAIFVYIEPEAAGSGIPNVKVFLNGCALRGLGALGLKTLVLKSIGVGLCVYCGFPAGCEGPMVQTGAILASQMARGFGRDAQEIHLEDGTVRRAPYLLRLLGMDGSLGSHQLHRDFVSMGCAAGVSAAFIAPIGGVLFSIEEVASYWSSTLTWRTFVCSAVAATTVSFCSGIFSGHFDDRGQVLFEVGSSGSGYQMWEVGCICAISAVIGGIGALFVVANKHMTLVWQGWARQIARSPGCCLSPKMFKLVEAVGVIWVCVTVFYWFATIFPCRAIGGSAATAEGGAATDGYTGGSQSAADVYGVNDDASHFSLNLIRFHCEPGEHSEMATLLMNPQEGTIVQLYSRGTQGIFGATQLSVFALLYFLTVCFVYGIAVPAGLFIPMMSGAALERLFGELVVLVVGEENSDPGLFSLCGAAAMLGGVTRMTVIEHASVPFTAVPCVLTAFQCLTTMHRPHQISVCVIMLELTNDITLALPMVLALAMSKAVGDLISDPIYEVHVELMGAPVCNKAMAAALPLLSSVTPAAAFREHAKLWTDRLDCSFGLFNALLVLIYFSNSSANLP